MNYTEFLREKSQLDGNHGFAPVWMPDWLFDFQKNLVEWATLKGRAAVFADCGLGKTPMQLVWAENIVRKTGGRVLILTPLAVATQTKREADKFEIRATVSRDGSIFDGITIANYEQLHRFKPEDFSGVVCDESSILKNFSGATRKEITQFMRKLPYRLLATATAAPNDYVELGTSSEALGYLGAMDMMNRFFKNDLNNSAIGRAYGDAVKWRLKGHAEIPFWRWVCSWARACRRPSDLGFDDAAFILPPLTETEYFIPTPDEPANGVLFPSLMRGLDAQRDERKRTIQERCEAIASMVQHSGESALIWCHLNDEADLLEKLITDAKQVKGAHSDEVKERRLTDFADGNLRVLVTKPRIGAYGLNLQICSHVLFFPSHSYEQFYQGVRRCWRFGQKNPVLVDIVATEGERDVLTNMHRKAAQADAMFSNLVREMNTALSIQRGTDFIEPQEVPKWL